MKTATRSTATVVMMSLGIQAHRRRTGRPGLGEAFCSAPGGGVVGSGSEAISILGDTFSSSVRCSVQLVPSQYRAKRPPSFGSGDAYQPGSGFSCGIDTPRSSPLRARCPIARISHATVAEVVGGPTILGGGALGRHDRGSDARGCGVGDRTVRWRTPTCPPAWRVATKPTWGEPTRPRRGRRLGRSGPWAAVPRLRCAGQRSGGHERRLEWERGPVRSA